jgi:hypothetical protein
LFRGAELNKGVIPFHVDADEFTVGREEHFEILALGCFFVEVNDEESFGGGNLFATFVFLAFDAAVSSGEFGA